MKIPKTSRKTRRLGDDLIRQVDPSFRVIWKPDMADGYTWDGTGVLRASGAHDLESMHDVIHVLYASKRRLKLPEWGLGYDPANHTDARRTVSFSAAEREEGAVCNAHWLIGAYLFGLEGALSVGDYLNTEPPPLQSLRALQRRAKLPEDFEARVRRVRKQATATS